MSVRQLRSSVSGSLRIMRHGAPLLMMAFLVDAAFLFVFLIALQTYLPESLHQSEAIAGYALAAFGFAKLLTQAMSGLVTDRLGTRRAIVLGTSLLLVADVSVLVLAHTAPWLIVLAGAVAGLGSSVTWPGIYAAAASRFHDDEKTRFTALLTLASGAALVAGLGGGAVLNATVSFNAAMVAPISAVALALVLALLTEVAGSGTPSPEYELPSLSEARQIVASPQRAAFAIVVLAEASVIGALTAAFRAYGRDVLDVSLAVEGLLIAPAAIAGGLMVIPGGVIADHAGARRVMIPGFALTGACLIALAWIDDPIAVAVTAAIAGAGFGLALPSIAATMMSLAGTGTRGATIGWFMTMDGLGHAVGPAAAGALLALAGASAVMTACGVALIAVSYTVLASRVGERTIRIEPVAPASAAVAVATEVEA